MEPSVAKIVLIGRLKHKFPLNIHSLNQLQRCIFFATLGSILDSQLSLESGKFQLARWSPKGHYFLISNPATHPVHRTSRHNHHRHPAPAPSHRPHQPTRQLVSGSPRRGQQPASHPAENVLFILSLYEYPIQIL